MMRPPSRQVRQERPTALIVTIVVAVAVLLVVILANRPQPVYVSTGAPAAAAPVQTVAASAPLETAQVSAGTAATNGANGRDGKDGASGADSTVPGPPGPAGAAGSNGVGISKVTCEADGKWVFTFTDASTQTVDGPCIAQNGQDGAAGVDGGNPFGWTYHDAYGFIYTCTRASYYTQTSPYYTCAQG